MAIYKSKYKIVKQLNQKNTFYKNSRLWKFYDKRGSRFYRKGFWHRQYLKLKSLNWMVKRRFLRPKTFHRERKKFKYRNYINSQKSFLQFYGKFKAKDFKRIFFLNYKKKRFAKLNFFLQSFELRPSMVLFRMKFFPTVFASSFFIRSKGFLLNGNLCNNINTTIKTGDIISVPKSFWFLFLYIFENKIYKRIYRFISFFNRKKHFYNQYKVNYYLLKKKRLNRSNVKLLSDFNLLSLNNTITHKYKKPYYFNALKKEIKYKKFSKMKKYKHKYKYKPRVFYNNYKNRSKLNLFPIKNKFKFNKMIFTLYQNLKYKIFKVKLFNKLKKLKGLLRLLYKMSKVLKNKTLFFLWTFIYTKYIKIKSFFVSDYKILNKLIWVNEIKKFLIKFNSKNKKKVIKNLFKKFILQNKLLLQKFRSKKIINKNNIFFLLNFFITQNNLLFKENLKLNNIKQNKNLINNKFNMNNINLMNIKLNFIQTLFLSNLFVLFSKNLIFNKFIKMLNIIFKKIKKKHKNLVNLKDDKIYLMILYSNIKKNSQKNIFKFRNLLDKNNKIIKFYTSLISKKYMYDKLSTNYIYRKRFFFWYNLKRSKLNIKRPRSKYLMFNKITKLKKRLLQKTRWRFFKKYNYSLNLLEFWYLPKFYEFDWYLLKGGVIRKPLYHEVVLPKKISFKNIVSGYKQNF